MLDDWGIDIRNIRIESLKISGRELQKSISNQAIDVSRQHSKAEKNRIDTEALAS